MREWQVSWATDEEINKVTFKSELQHHIQQSNPQLLPCEREVELMTQGISITSQSINYPYTPAEWQMEIQAKYMSHPPKKKRPTPPSPKHPKRQRVRNPNPRALKLHAASSSSNQVIRAATNSTIPEGQGKNPRHHHPKPQTTDPTHRRERGDAPRSEAKILTVHCTDCPPGEILGTDGSANSG